MPAEVISRWIDAQPEGAQIRTQDAAHLVHRDQAPRVLANLTKHGKLMRVTRGFYVAVKNSRLGPVSPPVNKIVDSLASITGHAIVRHGAVAANALGLTTQVPVRQIYLTDGRARTLNLGKQVIEIRHAPA
ncbi:MAG: type IV toxin-antitoxin system AbiEi family antitoxin domain-containing protein [Gammaproteobacteria bacterium]|nr:type IV toxin-antitoxin system AbiEi family antitoxin domain-containing protein [Gammaproteobacteria bacterium]MBK8307322.1 type IV toxin-antitoxin system AbiEi family antitoxin domain-containing protein [Gammaproteobacteria bacterium]